MKTVHQRYQAAFVVVPLWSVVVLTSTHKAGAIGQLLFFISICFAWGWFGYAVACQHMLASALHRNQKRHDDGTD